MKNSAESASIITAEQVPVWKRVLAIGSITLALAGCTPKGDVSAESTKTPTSNSATANPGETQTQSPESDIEKLIDEQRIPAGLSDEELAAAYIDRINTWRSSGSETQLVRGAVEANMSMEEYTIFLANEEANIFAPAIFGADFESNPNVSTLAANIENLNRQMLVNHVASLRTEGADGAENKEEYKIWSELGSVRKLNSTDTSRTLEITYLNFDNSDMNIVPEGLSPSNVIELTFTTDGESEVVTDSSAK